MHCAAGLPFSQQGCHVRRALPQLARPSLLVVYRSGYGSYAQIHIIPDARLQPCANPLIPTPRYVAPSIFQTAQYLMQLTIAWSDGGCACGRPSLPVGQPTAQTTALGLAKCAPVLCASRPAAHQLGCNGAAGAGLVRAPPPLLAPLPGEEAWLQPPAPDAMLGWGPPQQAGGSARALLAAALNAPLLPAEQKAVRLVPIFFCEAQVDS